MAPALSAFMAVKYEEEMVCSLIASGSHIVLGLEMILDKEAKKTHEQFATQIEARLRSGEGPSVEVWSIGRSLNDVRQLLFQTCSY